MAKPSSTAALLRSILYMPCSNIRALQKAPTLTACDGFIFDLEDAVAPADKVQARANAVQLISNVKRATFGRRQVVLRVNAADTEWFAHDVEAARVAKPDAVLLAKSERVDQLDLVKNIVGPECAVWAMIETPKAVINASNLAAASSCLVMGTVDLANELQCSTDPSLDRQPLMASLQQVVLAARAAGKSAIDGVFIHLDDSAGFERECRQGLNLGFDGKTLIHPKTIDAANQVFSPSAEAVEKAKRIIAAYKAAGTGVVVLDGRLVEALHVRRAFALLEKHEKITA